MSHEYRLPEGALGGAEEAPKRAWHCSRCGKLLGLIRAEHVYIRSNEMEAEVGYPVRRRCRCGDWNVLEQRPGR